MKVALIPCGLTEWQQEGRLLGRVELEASPQTDQRIGQWIERLRTVELEKILSATDELSRATARRIGRELGVGVKPLEALAEIDLGLWAGLTESELKKRYASAYRQLLESPLMVRPPQGEEFSAAVERMRQCLRRRIKANGKGLGLVLRPIGHAIARQVLEGLSIETIWPRKIGESELLIVECAGIEELVAET